jgi:hypothetical protein
MREDGQEYIGDAEIRATERRPEGVSEVRAFDKLAAQHALGRHIAFNDFHAKLAKLLVANIRLSVLALARRLGLPDVNLTEEHLRPDSHP